MRVAIVGSRNYRDYHEFVKFIDETGIAPTHIVSGGARGADSLAEKFAKSAGIPITIYPANWDKYGKSAGMIRNKQIVNDCEVVIAFPSPSSIGTRNTIDLAGERAIPTHVKNVLE